MMFLVMFFIVNVSGEILSGQSSWRARTAGWFPGETLHDDDVRMALCNMGNVSNRCVTIQATSYSHVLRSTLRRPLALDPSSKATVGSK